MPTATQSRKTPLALVNEAFGDKDKFVDKLVKLLDSDEAQAESKDDLRKRLLSVSNRKLLRLHRVTTAVKEKYGSRDALLTQTLAALGRAKDKDFATRLDGFSSARLIDVVNAATRRARRAGAGAPAPSSPASAPKRKPHAAKKA
jgi:hypothetical protein